MAELRKRGIVTKVRTLKTGETVGGASRVPHPTAEWLARQITEAFPWASAPAYLVRDNDGA
jgi:hypothetical protein